VDPLEFLARVLVHIPDKGHATTRYYAWYANRPRGMRGKAEPAAADGPPAIVSAPRLAGPAESHLDTPPRAGTFGVRVSLSGAPDPSPRRPGADEKRRPDGHRGVAACGGQATACPPALAGSATARYIRPILYRPRLNFLFCGPFESVRSAVIGRLAYQP